MRRLLLSAVVVVATSGLALVGGPASPPPALAASCPANTFLTTSETPTKNPDGSAVGSQALPWGLVGQTYSATIQVSGGTPPYHWSETGKSLPPGVNYAFASSSGTLNDEAVVSGTPSQSWKAGLSWAITDQNGCTTQFGTQERWDWFFGHPPQNNTPPFIDGGSSGMANVGDQITCVNGTWNEDPNFSPTREFGWFRNGVKPPFFTSDQGAYTVQADDQGKTLTCGVTETNMFGANEADSSNSITVPQGSADLTISKSVDTQRADVGENVTYTITVFNHGPDAAAHVGVIDSLPSGVQFVSATPSSGTCANNSGTIDCELGDMPSATGGSVTLVVTPTAAGSLTNRASIVSDTPDPNTSDNLDGITITVTAPKAPCPQIGLGQPLPGATAGVAYQATITPAGGQSPYQFPFLPPAPPGLSWTTSGTSATLAGKPTTAGTYPLMVSVTDANGCSATGALSLFVANPPPISVVVHPPSPLLLMSKTIINDAGKPVTPADVDRGDLVRYMIVIGNLGDATAKRVGVLERVTITPPGSKAAKTVPPGTATITLPTGATIDGATPPTADSLAPGKFLKYTVSVRATQPGQLVNSALAYDSAGNMSPPVRRSVEVLPTIPSSLLLNSAFVNVRSDGSGSISASCAAKQRCKIDANVFPMMTGRFAPNPGGSLTGDIPSHGTGRLQLKLDKQALRLLKLEKSSLTVDSGAIRIGRHRHRLRMDLLLKVPGPPPPPP